MATQGYLTLFFFFFFFMAFPKQAACPHALWLVCEKYSVERCNLCTDFSVASMGLTELGPNKNKKNAALNCFRLQLRIFFIFYSAQTTVSPMENTEKSVRKLNLPTKT